MKNINLIIIGTNTFYKFSIIIYVKNFLQKREFCDTIELGKFIFRKLWVKQEIILIFELV